MRLILLGAPGVGKGTQARFIADKFHILQLSTGNILRLAVKYKTPLGIIAKRYMNLGKLVPDDLVINIVKEQISRPGYKNGYLLDGFPRNITQAKAMNSAGIIIDYVLEINVPFDEIINRTSNRRIHYPSGRIYNLHYNPPKNENLDDITGEPLIQREDDLKETVLKRLNIYDEQTKPLIDYYKSLSKLNLNSKENNYPKYKSISGLGAIKDIQLRIFDFLK